MARHMMASNACNATESVGCSICASNISSKDSEIVVTTCGHLYHKQCLLKWFASAEELNGCHTCPDCRTAIVDKGCIKPIYLHFAAPDTSETLELVRMDRENRKLVRQVLENKTNLAKIAQQLKAEKTKTKHLVSKIGLLTRKLNVSGKYVCPRCEIKMESTDEKMFKAKNNVCKMTTETTSTNAQIVTKKLRSRLYSYVI